MGRIEKEDKMGELFEKTNWPMKRIDGFNRKKSNGELS